MDRLSIWVLALAGLFVGGTALAAQTQPQPARQSNSSAYVGADTCKTCHEDEFKSVQTTPHGTSVLKLKGGVQAHSCETCHGPGAEHVNAGGDKSKIFVFTDADPQVISKRCLECHEKSQEHGNFLRSPHATSAVACTSCHSPHHPKQKLNLLVQKQPLLCYGCHSELKAEFSKPFRHRVNEGLVKCSDCHNVHGGLSSRSLRQTSEQDQVCFTCHRNLQGPWVFEHVPVKTQGCGSCHMPHGSINPRLLIVNQVNLLCLQCHTATATPNTRAGESNAPGLPGPPDAPFHSQTMKFQACTMCHAFIHGSNADETFMK